MSTETATIDRVPAASAVREKRDAASLNFEFRWLILLGLILAAIMEVLDTTIINVALRQMAGNLSTTTQEIAWVSTGYILSNVVVLPMTAYFNARFGRRNYLAGSIILFTVASFFCGTSHSLGEIVFWRILQGAGGAALISTAQATLVQVFPYREQGIVQPLFLLGIVVAPTVGPSLGGWITDAASWNWCFFINVPIGVLALFLVGYYLHDTEPARPDAPADWWGIALLAIGLGSLQYVLEDGQQNDWFNSPEIVKLFVIAMVALVILVAWQLSPRNRNPVVDLRLLKNRSLSAGMVLFVAVGFGLYGVTYLYPLLAQTIQGMSPLQTGLALLPGGLTTAVSIVFCGAISSNPNVKVDARVLTLFGIGISIVAMGMFSRLGPAAGIDDTYWPLFIRGLSIGFLFVPVNQLAISSLKPEDVNQGTGLLGLARQLGGSIGLAILATYLEHQVSVNRAHLVTHVVDTNPALQAHVSALTGAMIGHGHSYAAAHSSAMAVIDQIVNVQSLVMSYNDTFLLLLAINLVMAPLLLLIGKAKPGAASSAMH